MVGKIDLLLLLLVPCWGSCSFFFLGWQHWPLSDYCDCCSNLSCLQCYYKPTIMLQAFILLTFISAVHFISLAETGYIYFPWLFIGALDVLMTETIIWPFVDRIKDLIALSNSLIIKDHNDNEIHWIYINIYKLLFQVNLLVWFVWWEFDVWQKKYFYFWHLQIYLLLKHILQVRFQLYFSFKLVFRTWICLDYL